MRRPPKEQTPPRQSQGIELVLQPLQVRVLVPRAGVRPLPPVVAAVSPKHGAVLPPGNVGVLVRFDRAMAEESVRSALRIDQVCLGVGVARVLQNSGTRCSRDGR